jgi:hypothetical protein
MAYGGILPSTTILQSLSTIQELLAILELPNQY